MYETIKSRVKSNNKLTNEFTCCLRERRDECLSPFLFAIYDNDIEEFFYIKEAEGVNITMFELFLLLYVDNITIFAETTRCLQIGLDI